MPIRSTRSYIGSDRIAALVEYFETYADCLVVALLSEDASVFDNAHYHVTAI